MGQDLHVAVVLTGEAAVRAGLTSITQEAKNAAAAAKSSASGMASGMSSALPSVRSVTDALGQQVAQLRAQAAAMKTPEHQAYAKAQQALRMEIEALTRSASGMASAVGSVSSATASAQAPTKSLSGAWADLAGKWFLASQAIGLVGGAVSSLVEDSAKWQMMRNSISDTEGSASKAAVTIKALVDAAKLPGLDLQPLSKGYVGFRSLNIEGEKAVRIMKAFGNAIALAGGGANEFERVNRQLLQMLGKGRVLQEDISIIAESMPRIRELTKEAFGTYDIEKIRESGVTANEFVDAVVAAAEKLPQASGSIKNSLDNASTATSQFRDQLMPDQGVQFAVDGWTNEIEAFTALFKAIISPVETAKGVIEQFTTTMQLNAGKTGEWLLQQKRARDLYGIKYETGSATSSQAMSGASFAAYSAGQAKKAEDLTKKQGAALIEVSKSLAKTDLAVALDLEREKWKGKLALFQEGSEEYKKVLRAQAAEEARIRKQFAPKAEESEAERIARHNLASEANVITNFDGLATLRSGIEWETQGDPEHLRNVQRAEDARKRAEKAALEDRKRAEKAALEDRERAQKEYTKLIQDENQKRIEFERQYWQQVQTSATSTINSIAQTLIMSGGSMKDKLRQILAQGESALISGGVNMLMGAAFAPATGGASMAMPGALGLLGSFMGMRATGGATLGPVGVGERGPEVFRPATPGTIYNSSSSHYNYSGPITVVVSGANANEVAKDLPRAIENAQRNRRQTSISR